MYYGVIKQFAKSLKNLDEILNKAKQHADAKKFDVNNFTTARLAPDMFAFTKQVQVACDMAKAAAGLFANKEVPKFPDTETTFSELQTRIHKTLDFLNSVRSEDFKHCKLDTIVNVPYPQGKAMYAEEALLSRAIPNFFFHLSMAYALLRAGGVELGKSDFIGTLNLFDAKN